MRGRARALGGCILAASLCLLPGTAVADPQRNIDVTPHTTFSSPFVFPALCVGSSSAPKPFKITNTAQSSGGEPLHVTSVTGPPSPDFTFTSVASQDIAPQGSVFFNVTFKPQSHGVHTDTLTVSSNDPDQSSYRVYVKGTGVDRRLSSDRSNVSFGEQRVGTRSPTQSLVIRNMGGDDVTVSSMTRRGTSASEFIVTAPALPITVAKGSFATLTIAFQPKAGGLRTAALEMLSNACTSPKLVVSLVGTGSVPNVSLTPNPVDVGASPKGKTSKPKALTLSNNGKAPLKITAIQVLGTDAADFALTGLPLMPVTVAPAGTLVFSVRMTASDVGSRSASINVISDDPDTPALAIPLRGSGGAASPSPRTTTSPTHSITPTASPTGKTSPQAIRSPSNDTLALGLVVGGVLFAFGGLLIVRRMVVERDGD